LDFIQIGALQGEAIIFKWGFIFIAFFYNYFNAKLNNKNFYYLDKDIILSKIDSIKKDIKIKEIKIIAKKIISKVQKKINKNILYPLSNTCHGDLTLGNIIINSKNTLLFAPSVEKIAVIKHANGIDYWVIAHGLNNNFYYAPHVYTVNNWHNL
jgi:tRNA A-37 threonylcarbamoyl transferase component Bud32